MTTRTLLCAIRLPLVLSSLIAVSWAAAAPRVLPEGKLPTDIRLQPLKDLDGYFPFTPPASKAEWTQRGERVRRQILVRRGSVADADPDAAERGHSWEDRSRGIYGREGLLRERAGLLRDRQSLSPEERYWQSARGLVRARALDRRAPVGVQRG